MNLELMLAAALGFIACAIVGWCTTLSAARPKERTPVGLSKAALILNELAAELQAKGLAKVDRDADGQVHRVQWAGECGVGISGEGSQRSHSSAREPDADQGPQL